MIFAIDPGCEESAYIFYHDKNIGNFGKISNAELLSMIVQMDKQPGCLGVIEMVASYGMPVGREIFETVFWIGRFYSSLAAKMQTDRAYRKDIKLHLCNNLRAKDANIRQALIDRLGAPGTKKMPGATYGIKADIWQALAVAVYWNDVTERPEA